MKRLLRVLLWLVAGLVVLAAAGSLGVWLTLRASLAQLDGRRPLPGLVGPVPVERDALGVPTVYASNRVDAARALGFLHAQERYFQMDLLRRRGAGELAALFGPSLLEHDVAARRHGLRAAARSSLEALPAPHRAVLDGYVAGVNAGLAALRARPPEYLLLRQLPEPWLPEDSLLVGYAMFFTLQDSSGQDDLRAAAARRNLPAAAANFFFPHASSWDAALDNSEIPAALPPEPKSLNFRPAGSASDRAAWPAASEDVWAGSLLPGSNSWGVQGGVSASGAAMVANDMHLDLGLPNIWFRACLRWVDATGERRRVVGVTLPGTPLLVVGSTGYVAWGFTNGTLDTTDIILIEADPNRPERYRTPDGWRDYETVTETITIAGESPRTVRYRRTVWGPVIDEYPGRPLALSWIAHRPGAMNLDLLDLEGCTNVAEALAIAPRCGIPVQNFLVGDRAGALAWTLIGRLPKRVGFDGHLPVSWADGTRRWTAGSRRTITRFRLRRPAAASGPRTTASPARPTTSPLAPGTPTSEPGRDRFATTCWR